MSTQLIYLGFSLSQESKLDNIALFQQSLLACEYKGMGVGWGTCFPVGKSELFPFWVMICQLCSFLETKNIAFFVANFSKFSS